MNYDEPDSYSRLTIRTLAEIMNVPLSTMYRWRDEGAPIKDGPEAIRLWRLRKRPHRRRR